MFYSNGKIIIHKTNNVDALHEAAEKLQESLLENQGIEAAIVFDEESEQYPILHIPTGVSFRDVEEILRPHIALKAINEDVIQLPETKVISVKYRYSDEDLSKLASNMTNNLLEKNRLENEKAAIMKEYKAKIDSLDDQINEQAQSHSRGYEYRDYKTNVKISFAEKKRYFVDANTDAIHKVEDLEAVDYQLRIDHQALIQNSVLKVSAEEPEGEIDEDDLI